MSRLFTFATVVLACGLAHAQDVKPLYDPSAGQPPAPQAPDTTLPPGPMVNPGQPVPAPPVRSAEPIVPQAVPPAPGQPSVTPVPANNQPGPHTYDSPSDIVKPNAGHSAAYGHGISSCDNGYCGGGCCDSGYCGCDSVLGRCKPACGINYGGWVQAGYHTRNNGLFNNHEDKLNLHQAWVYVEKVADGSCGWDWGFRADVVYGVDAQNTQAFGNNPGVWDFQNGLDHGIYGWAFPQLYGEVAKGDLSVKFGHFFTIMGYEVVAAPDNFFYSHAFTMNNSEPFTHTGVLATYEVSNDLTLYGGWTLGWDTGFDQFGSGSNFLGGFSYAMNNCTTLTFTTTFGDFGKIGDEAYSHSLVVDTQLTNKLNYVFQSDLVETSTVNDTQYGINQYLFYELNDCYKLGTRIEWWRNNRTSNYEWTVGVNYRPYERLVIRPEVRHEWTPANNFDQTIFGIDAIVTY